MYIGDLQKPQTCHWRRDWPHRNARLFTRQLQWAMHECKRVLNKEAPLEIVVQGQQSIQTATLQLRAANDAEGDVAQVAEGGAAQPAHAQVADGGATQPAQDRKKRRTQADDAARARRVCIRLASMANRCYWLSTTEITTHIQHFRSYYTNGVDANWNTIASEGLTAMKKPRGIVSFTLVMLRVSSSPALFSSGSSMVVP